MENKNLPIGTEHQERYRASAAAIVEHLGGRKMTVMTGAKFVILWDCPQPNVVVKLTIGNYKVVKITVVADLYNIEFWKTPKSKEADIKLEGYYDNMLVPAFEKHTGLRTKLF